MRNSCTTESIVILVNEDATQVTTNLVHPRQVSEQLERTKTQKCTIDVGSNVYCKMCIFAAMAGTTHLCECMVVQTYTMGFASDNRGIMQVATPCLKKDSNMIIRIRCSTARAITLYQDIDLLHPGAIGSLQIHDPTARQNFCQHQ